MSFACLYCRCFFLIWSWANSTVYMFVPCDQSVPQYNSAIISVVKACILPTSRGLVYSQTVAHGVMENIWDLSTVSKDWALICYVPAGHATSASLTSLEPFCLLQVAAAGQIVCVCGREERWCCFMWPNFSRAELWNRIRPRAFCGRWQQFGKLAVCVWNTWHYGVVAAGSHDPAFGGQVTEVWRIWKCVWNTWNYRYIVVASHEPDFFGAGPSIWGNGPCSARHHEDAVIASRDPDVFGAGPSIWGNGQCSARHHEDAVIASRDPAFLRQVAVPGSLVRCVWSTQRSRSVTAGSLSFCWRGRWFRSWPSTPPSFSPCPPPWSRRGPSEC